MPGSFGRCGMNELTDIPYAQPVQATLAPVSAEVLPVAAMPVTGPDGGLVRRRTDGFAVASAICGFTAIVPVISQVIGLALGVLSLARIGRAKRQGVQLPGTRWAVVGITSSGFALICWLGIFVGMGLLSASLSHSTESLGVLIQPAP